MKVWLTIIDCIAIFSWFISKTIFFQNSQFMTTPKLPDAFALETLSDKRDSSTERFSSSDENKAGAKNSFERS